MPKSKAPAKVVSKPATEEVQREPVKISNLYDSGSLKGALDDAAREVVVDAGYDEDVMVTNIKIVLGLAAIGSALYAQFGPGKFPATWWTVFACVVAYLILTLAMNLYSWRMEADAFLVTRPAKGGSGLRVASRMARFSDQYSLVLTDRADPAIEVSATFTMPSFFHADGYLADAAWRAEVEKLLASFAAAQAAGGRKGGAAKKDD